VAKTTFESDFELNQKVKVVATGRPGWVDNVLFRGDKAVNYAVGTTDDEGRPTQPWMTAAEIVPFE
jgi:hypothetical protein